MLSSALLWLPLSSFYALIVLTNNTKYAMNMSSMAKKIVYDFVVGSQIAGHTSHRVDGLRALAKMIASDLLTKHRNKTNKKRGRKVSEPQISEEW